MLEIINNLIPFFEDCYRRINIREYARITKISPPTASKVLENFVKGSLLLKEEYRNYIFFYANKDSGEFIDLSRMYWRKKLSDLILHLEKNLVSPTVVLFGSLSKGEAKSDSDVDLAIFPEKKDISFSAFEKKIKRNIQTFWFKSIKDIPNTELANNIINGYILSGKIWIGKSV